LSAIEMWSAECEVRQESGLPQSTIDTMRTLGDQIALRTTNGFGSTRE